MTVFRNGTIVDGTGRAAFAGDLYVEGDRIAEVLPAEAAGAVPESAEIVDASGCLVTPGFIDSHAHSDAYLLVEPSAPSKISQGITTEINGQCGGSAAPRYGQARLSSDWAAILGDRLCWRSFAEYRQAVEKAKIAVNTVSFIGHNTLRSSVVGYAGRRCTADELKEMCRLLDESLAEGGYGLTTGLIYQPGCYSDTEEVFALASVAARRGGYYATHMRSEGDGVLEAIDEVIALAARTGIRAEISHLKTAGAANWGKISAVLDKMESAVADGILLGADRYPFCAAGTDLDIVLPEWAQEGGAPAELARLRDPVLRRRIVAEVDASRRDWSQVMIGGAWHPETKAFSGRLVSEVADDPGEFVCRTLELDGCKTGAFFFGMSEENLSRILSRPWVVPGSDASLRAPWGVLGEDHPHPRAYATMPEFYRRLRELGVTRECAVARMTSVPAQRFGIYRRGVLECGAFADVAVWKDSSFGSASTYSSPHSFSTGVKAVMVNGAMTFLDGAFTGARGGRFIGSEGR